MPEMNLTSALATAGNALSNDTFIAFWVLAIATYWLGCICFLALSAGRTWSAFRRATKELETSSDAIEFSRNFSSYNEVLSSTPLLRHHWSEFTESLVHPASDEAPRPIRNTVEPAHYLNEAGLIDGPVHTRFYASVPNHLTALGILGTFVGLAFGIAAATESGLADVSNSDNVLKALERLLDGASVAFLTSIAGILGSLTFLFIERLTLSHLHRTLDLWVAALEARLELIRPETIALNQLREAEIQTMQLRRFNDQLILSLEQALEEKIANRLVGQLEKIEQAVNGLRTDQSHESSRAIEGLIAEFTAALSQRTGSDFDRLSATLSGIDATLQRSSAAMSETQDGVRSAISQMVGGMQSSMQEEVASLHQLMTALVTETSAAAGRAVAEASAGIGDAGNRAAQQISNSLSSFEEHTRRLEEISKNTIETVPRIGELVGRIDSFASTLGNFHREFSDSTESIRSSSEALRTASEATAQSVTVTESASTKVLDGIRALQQQWTTTSTSWAEYQSRFEGIDRSLSNAFSQMDEGLGRYLERVREFATVLDEKTASAIKNLAAATKELNENLEQLLDGRTGTDRR